MLKVIQTKITPLCTYLQIDKCNRLWVLDTGHIENLQVCNPKLLVFNLTDNELLDKYIIPQEMYSKTLNKSVLVNPVIETEGSSCNVKTVRLYFFICNTQFYISFDSGWRKKKQFLF